MDNAALVVDAALAPGALVPAYQPIVELETGEVVAFEALARWPGGGLNPGSVFAAASATGRVAEVDWACRTAALRCSLAADLPHDMAVFVNAEPTTAGEAAPSPYLRAVEDVSGRVGVVIELTERSLLSDPAGVLRTVDWARERGWRVAMDDVGAEPDSLQFLPFVNPDVIKLDLSVTQSDPGGPAGETMRAVWAQAESTGAVLLAEGIETAAHLDRARALEARYGQGWALGRPGRLCIPTTHRRLTSRARPLAEAATPFGLVEHSPRLQRGRESLLTDLTRQLELRAAIPAQPSMVLLSFQHGAPTTPMTTRTYAELVDAVPFLGVLGRGPEVDSLDAGVRRARLDPADAMAGQWTVVVIGPHHAAALIARESPEEAPFGTERTYDFVLTHHRDAVLRAARCLLKHL